MSWVFLKSLRGVVLKLFHVMDPLTNLVKGDWGLPLNEIGVLLQVYETQEQDSLIIILKNGITMKLKYTPFCWGPLGTPLEDPWGSLDPTDRSAGS